MGRISKGNLETLTKSTANYKSLESNLLTSSVCFTDWNSAGLSKIQSPPSHHRALANLHIISRLVVITLRLSAGTHKWLLDQKTSSLISDSSLAITYRCNDKPPSIGYHRVLSVHHALIGYRVSVDGHSVLVDWCCSLRSVSMRVLWTFDNGNHGPKISAK